MEGAEADVLRGADFSRARPKIIMVEAIKPFSLAPAWDEWEPMLGKAGYTYVWDDELNRYYVAEEARDLAEKLSAGPKWYAGGPQIGNHKPAAEDATHPDHRLARLLAGADMARLPLRRAGGFARPADRRPYAASARGARRREPDGGDLGAPVRPRPGRAEPRRRPIHSRRLSARHRFGSIPRRLRAHLRELFLVDLRRAMALRHLHLPPAHRIRYTAMRDPWAITRGFQQPS